MHERIQKIRLMRRLYRRLGIPRFITNDRGLQLAELAIVIPIFVLLFATVAEFGRFFYEYTTLAKAARNGARYLSTAKFNPQDPQVKNLVVYGNMAGTGNPILDGLEPAHVVITARNSAGDPQTAGVPATITVQILGYQHQPIFDLGGLLKNNAVSLAIDVKPSVTMRYLLTTPLV